MSRRPISRIAATLAVAAALLAGCTAVSPPEPDPNGPVNPVGDTQVRAESLVTPWSIVALDDGSALVSERDTGIVQHVVDDGAVVAVGTVPGVVAAGEGGLLGLALHAEGGERWLYAYVTTASDNRIVRMPLGDPLSLGAPEEVLTGLAKAGNHNGGRIAFGPDGMLYATVGDASHPELAQDRASLNGKILRMTAAGGVPDDNPFAGSLVYSLGHRNPQGLTWDDDGRLWAAEFGQNTWDEVNRIEAGANYGWHVVEGIQRDDRFVDPAVQFAPDEASPSGLVFIDGTFFLAGLRGERVWALYPRDDGTLDPVAWFVGEFGRIRDVAAAPDGGLWFVTNNTDGRGEARPGDDHMVWVRLGPPVEG
jgi:glucose/arabinose dehydrogenase